VVVVSLLTAVPLAATGDAAVIEDAAVSSPPPPPPLPLSLIFIVTRNADFAGVRFVLGGSFLRLAPKLQIQV